MNEGDAPIRELLATYKAAAYEKDVDAFMSIYDESVRVFDAWGVWSYEGVAAWKKMIASWFTSLGSERVVVDFDDVRTMVTSEVASLHAFVIYEGVAADGARRRAMHNRLTWTLRPTEGRWKVVHEHTSAPIDFETSKVMLERP